jgi:hypothetical protein
MGKNPTYEPKTVLEKIFLKPVVESPLHRAMLRCDHRAFFNSLRFNIQQLPLMPKDEPKGSRPRARWPAFRLDR